MHARMYAYMRIKMSFDRIHDKYDYIYSLFKFYSKPNECNSRLLKLRSRTSSVTNWE